MTWAVVMGGSSPIGGACARRLAEDGHDVVIQYLRHENQALEIEEAVRELGHKAMLVKHRFDREGDATDFSQVVTREVGEVDVLLVASAGGVMRPVSELSEHHLGWTLRASSIPLVVVASRLRPRSVVALSSSGSKRMVDNYAAIGMAKAALEAAVGYLAVELAPQSRVNAISVGLVDTPAARRLRAYEEMLSTAHFKTPLKRLVTPEDVAELASYLASDRSPMLTGEVVVLDGGYGLRW